MNIKQINTYIEKHKDLILEAERYIWNHPETGYKEYKTTAYMKECFEQLGYSLVMADGITGFYTRIETGRPGPEILILGELDSVLCPTHEEADPITGAVHSCGHNAQCAALLGIAAALKEPHALDALSGNIRLCAVPAEELLEIEYRSELMKQGIIKCFGGKTEFLSRGYFDGVDLAFMVHTAQSFFARAGSVGCLAKQIIYKGVASHAGSSPWNGKNALYAASLGLQAINSIRETFRESDLIRVHPIMTQGGSMVNAIPDTAVLESYIRGASFDAIERANAKVNRALIGAALSLGVNIEIIDQPGYAPLQNDKNLLLVTSDAFSLVFEGQTLDFKDVIGTGSTDLGDLSCIMPVIHPYAGGASGTGHGSDYKISDPNAACVLSAKWQLAMLSLLLENHAARAKEIVEGYKPMFSSAREYLDFLDRLRCSGNRIEYRDDGSVFIK